MSVRFTARMAVGGSYCVERLLPCVNGLSAWFVIAMVAPADESELGYTEGEFGSAEQRATLIVDALNKQDNLAAALDRAVVQKWNPPESWLAKISSAVAAYDRENFMTTADMHRADCACLRCSIDALRDLLSPQRTPQTLEGNDG